MMGRKLAIACFAAIAALAMTACSSSEGEGDSDAGIGADVVVPKDGGAPTCKPACGNDETCNTKVIPPRCEKLCNPPEGCSDLEVCDTSGAKPECKPVKCGNNQCERGQGCFDSLTGAPGGNSCTCLPDSEITSDTCVEFGMICDYDWDNGTPSKCKKPGNQETCLPSVGCETDLECTDVDGDFFCLRPCTKTEDCPSIYEYCTPNDPQVTESPGLRNKCLENFCSVGAFGKDPAAERAKYYQPCDAAGTGDGTCLPHWYSDGKGSLQDVGYCYQARTAPAAPGKEKECDPQADRLTAGAGYVGLCPANQLCSGGTPDPQNSGKMIGLCTPLCNAAPKASPAVGCDSGETCLDLTGLNGLKDPYPSFMQIARLGMCKTACDMFGNKACPDDGLNNKQGCIYTERLDENGYCVALRPDAGAWGEKCAPRSSSDGRMRCGDRTMCIPEKSGETCLGFCTHDICDDFEQFCSVCDSRACEACTPDCGGKVCGEDATGCSCGTCGENQTCNASGQCEDVGTCEPVCADKECGSDSCGGSCGTCEAGKVCNAVGKCITGTAPKCVPDCAHKTCGSDGCGGTCGNACGANQKCATKGGNMKCYSFSDAREDAKVGPCADPTKLAQ